MPGDDRRDRASKTRACDKAAAGEDNRLALIRDLRSQLVMNVTVEGGRRTGGHPGQDPGAPALEACRRPKSGLRVAWRFAELAHRRPLITGEPAALVPPRDWGTFVDAAQLCAIR